VPAGLCGGSRMAGSLAASAAPLRRQTEFSLLEVSKLRRIVGMWLIAAVQSIDPLGSGSVSSGHSAIGIALHVELAIILMCGLKAESFVEPQSRVDFHDGQAHSLIETCGLAD